MTTELEIPEMSELEPAEKFPIDFADPRQKSLYVRYEAVQDAALAELKAAEAANDYFVSLGGGTKQANAARKEAFDHMKNVKAQHKKAKAIRKELLKLISA